MNIEEIEQCILDYNNLYIKTDIEINNLKNKKQELLKSIIYWQSEMNKELKKLEESQNEVQ